MKKSTVWKILFRDRDIKEASFEELTVLSELENCVKDDEKGLEISWRIIDIENSSIPKSEKDKESKWLSSELSRHWR